MQHGPLCRLAILLLTLVSAQARATAEQAPLGNVEPGAAKQADLPQVTVEAQRRDLESRVHAYVSDITSQVSFDDSLGRWNRPVCPLVGGLTRDHAEAMLRRLTEIATQAGARMGPEHCQANLYVIATSEPERLLRQWKKRDRFLFGPPPPRDGGRPIEQFIRTNRAVRIWYNLEFTSTDGANASDSQDLVRSGDHHAPLARGNGKGAPAIEGNRSPRLSFDSVRALTSVLVIIDLDLVKGYTLRQLVDYVGLVSLAEVNLDSPIDAAPSILHLFTASERPPGMSRWDDEFLRGLYHTEQDSRWQRSRIMAHIVYAAPRPAGSPIPGVR